jgi:FMN reductase
MHELTKAMGPRPAAVRVVALSAGVSDPSSTRLLTERLLSRVTADLRASDVEVQTPIIDLAPLATDIANALTAGFPSAALREVIGELAAADAVVAATPVYKAGLSGLFKAFVDVLDNDLLVAKPVLLAGTAGTARHAMVVDDQMRPLFAFMRALTTPTSVFAAPEDWADPALGRRIARASTELVSLLHSGAGPAIAAEGWAGYQHEFGGNAARSAKETADVDFGSDLMQLAAGGSLSAPRRTAPAR